MQIRHPWIFICKIECKNLKQKKNMLGKRVGERHTNCVWMIFCVGRAKINLIKITRICALSELTCSTSSSTCISSHVKFVAIVAVFYFIFTFSIVHKKRTNEKKNKAHKGWNTHTEHESWCCFHRLDLSVLIMHGKEFACAFFSLHHSFCWTQLIFFSLISFCTVEFG